MLYSSMFGKYLSPNDERLDLFRERGARAALPQNCSLAKIMGAQDFANGTVVLLLGPKVLYVVNHYKFSF
jgi:hypothetical protein